MRSDWAEVSVLHFMKADFLMSFELYYFWHLPHNDLLGELKRKFTEQGRELAEAQRLIAELRRRNNELNSL